ncbi:MAG: hypothetical protein ACI8TA_003435, partial [Cyclobacteriaceae bacterium]
QLLKMEMGFIYKSKIDRTLTYLDKRFGFRLGNDILVGNIQ